MEHKAPPCVLSPCGRLLATATHSGRVVLRPLGSGSGSGSGGVDAAGAVPLRDHAHLGRAVTAVAFPAGGAGGKKKGKAGKKADADADADADAAALTLVAVGDALGTVTTWNPATGALLTRCDGVHAGPVRSVCVPRHRRQAVSVGGGARGLMVVTALSGSGAGAAAGGTGAAGIDVGVDAHVICAHPVDAALVIVGGTSVVLWDLAAGCARARFAGHAGRVAALAFAPDGDRFASAGEADRFVSVWQMPDGGGGAAPPKTQNNNKKKKGGRRGKKIDEDASDDESSASGSAASSSSSSSSSASSSSSNNGVLQVTDAARTLVAKDHPFALSFGASYLVALGRHVLCAFPADGGASDDDAGSTFVRPEDPLVQLRLPGGSSADPGAAGSDAAAGSSSKKKRKSAPRAHAADPDAHDSFLGASASCGGTRVVAVRGSAACPVLFDTDLAAVARGETQLERLAANVGLPDAGDGATAPRPLANPPQGGRNVEVLGRVDQLPPRAAAVRAAATSGSGVAGMEPTFEERLRELSVAGDAQRVRSRKQQAQRREASSAAAAAAAAGLPAAGTAGAAPKADSLRPVLEQAVTSGDASLLEYCLSVTDKRVIDVTVAALPARLVVPFTAAVVTRFRSKPSRGMTLSAWIRSLLRHHTPSLVSSTDLVSQLQGLYQSIEERVRVHQDMMRLGGRLDVLMVQIEGRKTGGSAGQGPVTVFRDDGSADPRAAGDGAAGGSSDDEDEFSGDDDALDSVGSDDDDDDDIDDDDIDDDDDTDGAGEMSESD
jgi:hypothetical protein